MPQNFQKRRGTRVHDNRSVRRRRTIAADRSAKGVGRQVRHCEAGDEDQRDRYISRAREGEVTCKRDRDQEPHSGAGRLTANQRSRSGIVPSGVGGSQRKRKRSFQSSETANNVVVNYSTVTQSTHREPTATKWRSTE